MKLVSLNPSRIYVVNSSDSRTNYNNIFAGTIRKGTEVCIFQSAIMFNFMGISPKYNKIISCKLKLVIEGTLQGGRNFVNIGYLPKIFDESFPIKYVEGEYISITRGDIGKEIEIDVTNIVTKWLESPVENNGFSVVGIENRYNTLITLSSPVLKVEVEESYKYEPPSELVQRNEYNDVYKEYFMDNSNEANGNLFDLFDPFDSIDPVDSIDPFDSFDNFKALDELNYLDLEKSINKNVKSLDIGLTKEKGAGFFYSTLRGDVSPGEKIFISDIGFNNENFILDDNTIKILNQGLYLMQYSILVNMENGIENTISVLINNNNIPGTISSIVAKYDGDMYVTGTILINVDNEKSELTINNIGDNILKLSVKNYKNLETTSVQVTLINLM